MSYSRGPYRQGPPVWLVFVAAGILVVGGYLIWTGARSYVSSELRDIVTATSVAAATATAGAPPSREPNFTPPPSLTPVPPCQDFVVTAAEAIVRECPSTSCAIEGVRRRGEVVCVLEPASEDNTWWVVNLNAGGFVLDLAYMHESILRPGNPTATMTITASPLPTITQRPSRTPLPTPRPTNTPDPATPPTMAPTLTPTPTPPLVSI